QEKLEIYQATLMMGLLIWLLAFRAIYRWKRTVNLTALIGLAIFAPLATALFEAGWYGTLTGVPYGRVLALNLMFDIDIRPAWWVFAASLAICAAYLAAQWLRPKQPRVKFRPMRAQQQ